ncbi:MAG: hypothetical protein ACYC0T_02825 [Ramlibacter sp.]
MAEPAPGGPQRSSPARKAQQRWKGLAGNHGVYKSKFQVWICIVGFELAGDVPRGNPGVAGGVKTEQPDAEAAKATQKPQKGWKKEGMERFVPRSSLNPSAAFA